MTNTLLIAAVLILEAGGEGQTGMEAVYEVICTRASQANRTRQDIVLAPKQFSCMNGRTVEEAIRLAEKHPLWKDAVTLASEWSRTARTYHATHYYAYKKIKPPSWAKRMTICTVIGNHMFLKDDR